jgi:hypothetical protein
MTSSACENWFLTRAGLGPSNQPLTDVHPSSPNPTEAGRLNGKNERRGEFTAGGDVNVSMLDKLGRCPTGLTVP